MKPDTTEARRLADELAADVAPLLREGLSQEALRADAAQSAIRALADENERMRDALEQIAGFDPYNSDGMRTIAREALK